MTFNLRFGVACSATAFDPRPHEHHREHETMSETHKSEVLIGERCRYCKQPISNPDDLPGPRACEYCRIEAMFAREDDGPDYDVEDGE